MKGVWFILERNAFDLCSFPVPPPSPFAFPFPLRICLAQTYLHSDQEWLVKLKGKGEGEDKNWALCRIPKIHNADDISIALPSIQNSICVLCGVFFFLWRHPLAYRCFSWKKVAPLWALTFFVLLSPFSLCNAVFFVGLDLFLPCE